MATAARTGTLLALLLLCLLLCLLAGCASRPGPAPTSSATTTPAHCTPARGISQGLEVLNGTYAAPDGSVWRETNGLPHLQTIPTCEGAPDTKVAPPA
jgi:hypothetical protein